jgi:hypothetical protein
VLWGEMGWVSTSSASDPSAVLGAHPKLKFGNMVELVICPWGWYGVVKVQMSIHVA